MKKIAFAIIGFILLQNMQGQTVQTILPVQPVIEGTAFQIQYVISNPSDVITILPPDFDSLRLVSGPNHYKGNALVNGKQQTLNNITYTFVASKPGNYSIKGIDVTFKNNIHQKAGDVFIKVVTAPKASYNTRSNYTDVSLYAPPAKINLQQLIKDNLFVKTEVNKTTVIEGEPVVATFTLYSRLQSSSQATKSPSLYGFSIVDMVDINKPHLGIQTIEGKVFNTSVLRKMQLYPVESGAYTIDKMYLHNEIEFDDSVKKGNKIIIPYDIITNPVKIKVRPLPLKSPENFSGAVGSFIIKAYSDSNIVKLHQQSEFKIEIKGSGNFVQFAQPLINTPKGMNVTDINFVDKLNNEVAPQEGKRMYTIKYTADSIGNITIPPVIFSYFDVKSNGFKTIHSDSLFIKVLPYVNHEKIVTSINNKGFGIPAIIIIALLLIVCFYLFQFKRVNKKPAIVVQMNPISYAIILSEYNFKERPDKENAIYIQKVLTLALNDPQYRINDETRLEIQALISKLELIIYSNSYVESIEKLREEALNLLNKIN
jgi:hypothetical protein